MLLCVRLILLLGSFLISSKNPAIKAMHGLDMHIPAIDFHYGKGLALKGQGNFLSGQQILTRCVQNHRQSKQETGSRQLHVFQDVSPAGINGHEQPRKLARNRHEFYTWILAKMSSSVRGVLPSFFVHKSFNRRESSTYDELDITALSFCELHRESVAAFHKLLALVGSHHAIHKLSPMWN
jgi:hypothetical protein